MIAAALAFAAAVACAESPLGTVELGALARQASFTPDAPAAAVPSPLKVQFMPGPGAPRAREDRLLKRIAVTWAKGEPREDGRVPFYARAVDVLFAADPRLNAPEEKAWLSRRVEEALYEDLELPSPEKPLWVKPSRIARAQQSAADRVLKAVDRSGREFIEWRRERGAQASAAQQGRAKVFAFLP